MLRAHWQTFYWLMLAAELAFLQEDEATQTYQRMSPLFADASLYLTQVPTYAAGFMTLGWGCHSTEPRQTNVVEITRRVANLDLEARYYTPDIHVASFALPGYIKNLQRD